MTMYEERNVCVIIYPEVLIIKTGVIEISKRKFIRISKRKFKINMSIIVTVIIYFIMLTALPFNKNSQNIISLCIADVTGDGEENVVAITGKGSVTDDNIRYGEALKVYGSVSIADIQSGKAVPIFEEDFSKLYPLKVQAGDIDGDGYLEISVCVYKTTEFHPVMAIRPFFYRLQNNGLVPVWLGSRLSRPFTDFILADVNGDQTDEIVSIELLENGDKVVSAYYWKGFGFELLFESRSFSGVLSFVANNEDEIIIKCDNAEGVSDYRLWPDEKYESFNVEKILKE